MEQRYLIGIDEAGRGPLAGPVSVGVACVPQDFDWKLIPGVNDSKKLTEKKREEIFARVCELVKAGKLEYSVVMTSAFTVDAIGIVPSVNRAMSKALKRLSPQPVDCIVKLDGSLRAPFAYEDQTTIIGGDGKEKIIGLASIMAKVTRDRHMIKIARKKEFSLYSFEIHKGYGTRRHREAIIRYGLSDIHRRSFCTNLIKG